MESKQLNADVQRIAQLVHQYWNYRKEGCDNAGEWYSTQLDSLREEIGDARVDAAREEYEERQFWACETREAAWIEEHYR